MTAVRAVLVAITILVLAVAPSMVSEGSGSSGGQAAYAASAIDSATSARQATATPVTPTATPVVIIINQNGNGNGNGNNNGNNNGNGNGNDNDDDDDNGNGNGNGNDNDDVPDPILVDRPGGVAVGTGTGTATTPTGTGRVSRCFDIGQVGVLSLILPGGSVTLDVVPNSSFPSVSQVTMSAVNPASVPATPGGRLDDIVFNVTSAQGCAGAGLGQFPSDVNLGIAYSVSADKSRLRIARLEGDRWVDVNTVPDPSPTNPYISSTIRQTGTYAVYSAP